jgi:hypothetical protein
MTALSSIYDMNPVTSFFRRVSWNAPVVAANAFSSEAAVAVRFTGSCRSHPARSVAQAKTIQRDLAILPPVAALGPPNIV